MSLRARDATNSLAWPAGGPPVAATSAASSSCSLASVASVGVDASSLSPGTGAVSYTHLRAHETSAHL
eukprot:2778903-Alexandrium_andersonii.AAC.1